MKLYVNSSGNSCLRNWTDDELRQGYDIAERENDDLFYMCLMNEFERRHLRVVDKKPLAKSQEGE